MSDGHASVEELCNELFDGRGNLHQQVDPPEPGAEAWVNDAVINRTAAERALGRPERVLLRLVDDAPHHTEWAIQFGHLQAESQDAIWKGIKQGFESTNDDVSILDGTAALGRPECGRAVVRSRGKANHYTWMHTFQTRLQKILLEDVQIAVERMDTGRFNHSIAVNFGRTQEGQR